MADLVYTRILRQATETPGRVALRRGAETISFEELDRRSAMIAGGLAGRGMGPGSVVAVRLARDIAMMVTLLGVLRSGAAYLPLDATDPSNRSAAMVADAEALLIVSDDWAVEGADAPPVLRPAELAAGPATEAPAGPGPSDVAYVIFTSGSTGRPKGVEVTHRSVAALFAAMDSHVEVAAGDVWLSVTSPAFDISVFEFFWTLGRGMTVELADTSSAGLLSTALTAPDHDITHLGATPTLLTGLLLDPASRRGLGRLRHLTSSGEALPPALAAELRSLLPGRFINAYGPTEATIWSTVEEITDPPTEPLGIGHPLAGQRVDVLDDALVPVAPGQEGELCIGGVGLAKGYRFQPELTAARFPPDPRRPGERLYRTGDVARLLPDGRLECRGRFDRQVKVRGHRIELDEVEHALQALPRVGSAAVICKGSGPDARLIAHVVATGNIDAREIRGLLAEVLPAAAVPAQIRFLDELPTTVSGKLDRQQLM